MSTFHRFLNLNSLVEIKRLFTSALSRDVLFCGIWKTVVQAPHQPLVLAVLLPAFPQIGERNPQLSDNVQRHAWREV